MSEVIVSFGSRTFKFCLQIKIFASILKNEALLAKFKWMIANIAKTIKKLVKKALISKIDLKDDWMMIVSYIGGKYGPI